MKCLIIDDDPLITDLVVHFAEKCDLIEYCVSCNNSIDGLKLLTDSSFDVLFLDYNMPGLSGQDLLDLKKDDSLVIMITSNTDFAVASYRYDDVYDYLVKPLEYDSFSKAVTRIAEKLTEAPKKHTSEPRNSIMLRDGNNWIPVNFTSIQFIKSESNYCIFHLEEGKVMSLAKLKELELKLPSNFIRCHRSYIVNTDYITKINLDDIWVSENNIPISTMYKEDIKQFIESNT